MATLLQDELSLFAFDLTLDAHPALGNNAQLAQRLGFEIEGGFGEQNIAACGRPPRARTPGDLRQAVAEQFGLRHRFIDVDNRSNIPPRTPRRP